MLNRLLLEHDHILRKLNLLELQYLEMCRGRTPDYSLMRSIIVYIQEYPEQIHHPLEDMIFSILLERVDDIEFVQKLITQHTRLEVATRKIRDSLESVSSGEIATDELKQQLAEFLVDQREHIYSEEIEVYPLVQSILTKEDWKQLQAMVPILDEPIFGRATRDDYERLYREIEDQSKAGMLERVKIKRVNGHLKFTENKRKHAVNKRSVSLLQ